MKIAHSDPENYRKMSQPFADTPTANEAITRFNELVSDARKACGIREVLVVIAGGIKSDDGEEGEYITSFSFGRSTEIPALAAYALGEARNAEKQRIEGLLGGKLR